MMSERKLASIQKIKIEPIPNADRVELGKVLGWTTIVGKGEFQDGDLCCFLEIDSVAPEKPMFEFMRKFKYRVRTMKSAKLGIISQGLAIPLQNLGLTDVKEGDDVTELLGIQKYEQPVPTCLFGKVKGGFPTFLPKTDETRVQLLQTVLDKHKGLKCFITEKIDGTSTTYYTKDGVFGVCGRNYEFQEDDTNAYCEMARKIGVKEKLLSLGKNIAIQGELFGDGLQGNPLKLQGKHIMFFNAFNIDKGEYYDFTDFVQIIEGLGLQTVPILTVNYELSNSIPEIVEMAKGNSVLNKDCLREGIVIRPLLEKLDLFMSTNGGFGASARLSFKSINQEYLISNPEA
jgi:RNA ligase (TIGR02306 family)